MRGIILYLSKHGSTRQYAEWLGEDTGFQTIDLKKKGNPDLKNIEIVVIGSWIFASKMVAHGWIKKNWSGLKNKQVIIFSTSGADPNEELKKEFLEASLPENIRKEVTYFPLWGRFQKEDQSFIMRNMLKIASKIEKDGDLAKDMVVGVDGVKKENLKEIIEHIKAVDR